MDIESLHSSFVLDNNMLNTPFNKAAFRDRVHIEVGGNGLGYLVYCFAFRQAPKIEAD